MWIKHVSDPHRCGLSTRLIHMYRNAMYIGFLLISSHSCQLFIAELRFLICSAKMPKCDKKKMIPYKKSRHNWDNGDFSLANSEFCNKSDLFDILSQENQKDLIKRCYFKKYPNLTPSSIKHKYYVYFFLR